MPPGHGDGMRTLVVGIDGACPAILGDLFAEGVAPRLASIFERGASGRLRSGLPPSTATAWPSLVTGMNPGRHGVFGAHGFDGYEATVVNATHVRERPLWQILDMYGLVSVVVNVPLTSPPGPFDGALVPGYLAPEDPPCHPSGLLDGVESVVGDYRVYSETGTVEEAVHLIRTRGRAFRYLARRYSPDFGLLHFQQPGSVALAGSGGEAVARTYAEVDAQLEDVLAECRPDNVLVVSAYAAGRCEGYEFRVNEFLCRRGLLASHVPAESPASRGAPDRRLVSRAVDWVRSAVEPTGSRRPTDVRPRASGPARGDPSAGGAGVSYPDSRAFMRSPTEPGVRINLEGREPEGRVDRETYVDVRDRLVSTLGRVRTPDGEPVFDDVAPRESYVRGPEAERAPDVVLDPADRTDLLVPGLGDGPFGAPRLPGTITGGGTFAARGTDVSPGGAPVRAHVCDVAPTVLSTLGVPSDVRTDGTTLGVVESAGERPYPEYDPPRQVAADAGLPPRLADLTTRG